MTKFHIEFDVEGSHIAGIPLDYQLVVESVAVAFEPRDAHGAKESDCEVSNLTITERR